jgi:DUF4097 and DUF4098 domain-containing protein YvlB
MGNRTLVAGIAAALTFLTACDLEEFDFGDAHGGRYTEDFHHSYPLKPGGRLSVENFNGTIEISGWNENSIQIDGTKYAPTPELRDAMKIDINAQSDSISIRTVRPSERRGNMGARYYIRVPRRTELDRVVSSNGGIRATGVEGSARLKTTNGGVRIEDLKGALDAQTTNGGIDLRTHEGSASLRTTNGRIRADALRGALEAFTSNGGITAQIAAAEAGKTIRLETTNGSVDLNLDAANRNDVRASTTNGGITLHLPDRVNARVIAVTSHSNVHSDFEVQTSRPSEKHRLEGVIGSGGPTFDLSSTNGSIRILKQ